MVDAWEEKPGRRTLGGRSIHPLNHWPGFMTWEQKSDTGGREGGFSGKSCQRSGAVVTLNWLTPAAAGSQTSSASNLKGLCAMVTAAAVEVPPVRVWIKGTSYLVGESTVWWAGCISRRLCYSQKLFYFKGFSFTHGWKRCKTRLGFPPHTSFLSWLNWNQVCCITVRLVSVGAKVAFSGNYFSPIVALDRSGTPKFTSRLKTGCRAGFCVLGAWIENISDRLSLYFSTQPSAFFFFLAPGLSRLRLLCAPGNLSHSRRF